MLRLPLTDIRTIYASHLDDKLELEARIGSFTSQGFIGTVSRETFTRLRESLNARVRPTVEHTTDYISGIIRKTIPFPRSEEEESKAIWMKKDRLWLYDIRNFGLRITISRETPIDPIPNFKPSLIRTKNRYSYPARGGTCRIDLTVVDMEQVSESLDRTHYEIEVELLNIHDLNVFGEVLGNVLRLVQDTHILYTLPLKHQLITYINSILRGRQGSVIDSRILVQARNLQLRDMVWGGLIGNKETSYTVTHKADGLRRLLVFAPSGIWLVYPPSEANLLTNEEFPGLSGTILDGELIPPSKRKPGAPKSKYWFLVFDCLIANGDITISSQPHRNRMLFCQAVADKFKDNTLLVIHTKTFVTLDTVENFFILMKKFFDQQPSLSYEQDGFMFTPEFAPYHPPSDKIPLHSRILTVVPDVCKWKPSHQMTIDFLISWKPIVDESGHSTSKLFLYALDRYSQLALFKGTEMYPFSNQVDSDASLTKDLPTGTIVEYRWDSDRKLLVPVRIRHDKVKPNRLDVAITNWNWIHDPVSTSTLRGEDLALVRKYHNRIKRALYRSLDPEKKTLLDIGSGQGGDAAKWKAQGFHRIVAVEPNPQYHAELKHRLESVGLKTLMYQDYLSTRPTDVQVLLLPARGEDTNLIRQALNDFVGGPVDAISLMQSMTFFWSSPETVKALARTLSTCLKPDGTVLFLTMDGDTVFQMFRPAFSGLEGNRLRLGSGMIEYHNEHELTIDLPGTIVNQQKESLVYLTDLLLELPDFELGEIYRATTEKFLNPIEKLYTEMYSFGYLVRSGSSDVSSTSET